MGKEIKLLIFMFFLCIFIFFTVKYYISDVNEKKTFMAIINNDEENLSSNDLPLLKNDTDNIIEYVDNYESINIKKKRRFWDLIK